MMMMAYRIVEHTQTGPNTRRLKVLVNPAETDAYTVALDEYTAAKAKRDGEISAVKAWADAGRNGDVPLIVTADPGQAPADPSVHESFDWGLDVPEEQALAETRLLLDAKYPKPVDLGKLGEL